MLLATGPATTEMDDRGTSASDPFGRRSDEKLGEEA